MHKQMQYTIFRLLIKSLHMGTMKGTDHCMPLTASLTQCLPAGNHLLRELHEARMARRPPPQPEPGRPFSLLTYNVW